MRAALSKTSTMRKSLVASAFSLNQQNKSAPGVLAEQGRQLEGRPSRFEIGSSDSKLRVSATPFNPE